MNSIKSELVENFHGTKVADPYRWLENPESPETISWGKEFQQKAEEYFSGIPSLKEDKKRLTELYNYTKFFVPQEINDSLFFQRIEGLQNQAVLYRKSNSVESIVIDPNTLSEDGTVAMTNYSISGDSKYIAYATSRNGSDWQEIRVRAMETGEELKDVIRWCKFTNIAWAPDHSGFYYSRLPEQGTVKNEDENNYSEVYFHKIGTSQAEDELFHKQPENKELRFTPYITEDKKYLYLHVSYGTAAENRFYYKPLESKDAFIRLLDDQDAQYTFITNKGSIFYYKTDFHAPRGRIIAIDIDQPERENWKEIVAEQENVINTVRYINDQFVIVYMKDAHDQIHLYGSDGTFIKQLEIPVIGSLTELTRNEKSSCFYFGITSFLNPTIVYQYDFSKDHLVVFAQSALPIDTSKFETKQVFFTSKDGTRVPMFLTLNKDIELDGQNQVIVYGYGGFNNSVTPAFNPAILRWLEKGGIFASVNLRGGSEYGEEWHKAGMLENKQNVFDDYISAAEWLISNRYTSTKKLSIWGRSNGGLLVAACMIQRPDLYGAVLCQVPVIDMLRYHKFTVGRFWVPEYGNAEENAEHFKFMYKYSPLHNVQEGVKYPPVLIATAESDDRVVPAHAKKFAATLTEKADPESTVVLRLESKAGHGLGKPTSKIIDEWVDFFAFLDKELA